MTVPSASEAGFGLYIHWPFCVSKCPYCDFNSHVRENVDVELWRQSLLNDLRYEAQNTAGRTLTSIFFGGGTPSLMPPALVSTLIEEASRLWGFAPDIEITLEANPSSVEAARFADLAVAGVNRVSLGLQALEDPVLRMLGRAHDVSEGLAALDVAQQNFARVSFDLIYALPDQTEAEWEAILRRAIGFGTDHLSLYQLTIEPGTRFATLVSKGELTPLDPDQGATLFELTEAVTRGAGIPRYEISNHARPGEESRHNLCYWRYGDYLGVGPGAHGRRNGIATLRHRKPENWLSAVERNRHGASTEDPLTVQDRTIEALLMGLRLDEGIDLARLGDSNMLDRDAIVRLQAQGLLQQAGSRLRVTRQGMLLLDAILRDIIR